MNEDEKVETRSQGQREEFQDSGIRLGSNTE